MAKAEKVTLSLPEPLKREARARAIREGKTLSEVVRGYLEQYVKGDDKKPKEDET